MREHIDAALGATTGALAQLRADDATLGRIEQAAGVLADSFAAGGRALACGNGGSLCDAMHFAEELSGSFRAERAPLAAVAIADAAHLTCAANDFGFEHAFSRYVTAHARRGDVLVAISTSGRSPNVIMAAEAARAAGAQVIALTGREGSALGDAAEIDLCTPAGPHSDRVQELHIVVLHLLVELVERRLFPENYALTDARA